MSLSISIALFFAVTVMYIMIIDIFTVLFRMSGMSEEKAKFQVISLLTNSGFTTKESELITGKLVRRRLGRTVMLFGYIFSVTIITVFVNLFMNLPKAMQQDFWTLTVVLLMIFVAFMIIKRISGVKKKFSTVIERLGRKLMFHGQVNIISVIDQYAKGVVADVGVDVLPEVLVGKTLEQISMPTAYGVRIILIQRNGQVLDYITKDMNVEAGDKLVVFGRWVKIIELFSVDKNEKHEDDYSEEEN
ncbi:MAG: TrkA C-terminal domain-containing protein [Christensenella sp.]